jgi:hypothetical protein
VLGLLAWIPASPAEQNTALFHECKENYLIKQNFNGQFFTNPLL